jgi:hypothetical protein
LPQYCFRGLPVFKKREREQNTSNIRNYATGAAALIAKGETPTDSEVKNIPPYQKELLLSLPAAAM